jgi:hypothetical protein
MSVNNKNSGINTGTMWCVTRGGERGIRRRGERNERDKIWRGRKRKKGEKIILSYS